MLVTVFASASRHAAAHGSAGRTAAEQARHALVVGADHGFLVASLFLATAVVLVLVLIRRKPTELAAPFISE